MDYISYYAKIFKTQTHNVGYYHQLDYLTKEQVKARFGRHNLTEYVYHIVTVHGRRVAVARRPLEPGDLASRQGA